MALVNSSLGSKPELYFVEWKDHLASRKKEGPKSFVSCRFGTKMNDCCCFSKNASIAVTTADSRDFFDLEFFDLDFFGLDFFDLDFFDVDDS